MSYLFSERETFNDNISGWDVSSCEDMSNMFEGSSSFDIDISSWDVSSVTTSKRMFSKATSFNRDLSKWNIESFTTMTKMFFGALTFNQNLCLWKDDFPSDSAIDIFTESGCTYTTMPPFCADDCAVSLCHGYSHFIYISSHFYTSDVHVSFTLAASYARTNEEAIKEAHTSTVS